MMPSKNSYKHVCVWGCVGMYIHIYTDLLGHCPAVVLVDFLEGIGQAVELACDYHCFYDYIYMFICVYVYIRFSSESTSLISSKTTLTKLK
jgi:hypothetical protein